MINIENWSKWLLDDPVYYIKYGAFRPSESSEFVLIKQTNVFHERERSSFTFHINQKVEERFSFQPKVNDTKVSLVTSTFYFSTIYLFSLFSVPRYICFLFSVFHEREVFPSHREVVVVENDGDDRCLYTIAFLQQYCFV